MKLGIKKFKTPIFALEETEKAMGMQILQEIDEDTCMIFPYYTPQTLAFHMAEVKFPIDMIFCDKNKVVKVFNNIQPNDKKIYRHYGDCVIETMGGLCDKYGIKEGTPVYI
jgi:uncharacterized membrane protein (UPF0127 family)